MRDYSVSGSEIERCKESMAVCLKRKKALSLEM